MKILRLLILFILTITAPCFAYDNNRTVESVATTDTTKALFNTIAANATFDTVSESLINTGLAANVGVMYKATSSGTVNFSIQALRSFQRPASETASDASYVVWNAANTVTDTNWHMATLDTVVEPYLRFRITNLTGNNSGTTVQIKVSKQ